MGILIRRPGRDGRGGPRALGARSLLGHPGRRANLIRINRIKQRELWRPLAPSILAEHAAEFFEPIAANLEFMTVAAQIRGDVQHLVPAIVGVPRLAQAPMTWIATIAIGAGAPRHDQTPGAHVPCSSISDLLPTNAAGTHQDHH